MISTRALGVLMYLASQPDPKTVEEVREAFGEGRDALYSAFNELEINGYLTRTQLKINDRHLTVRRINQSGFEFLGSFLNTSNLLQLSELTNTSYLTTNLLTISTGGAREEYQVMPYEFFSSTSSDDEALEERRKAQAKKKADYEAAKAKKNAERQTRRENLDPKDWSCLDVGHEFANRVHQHWNIKPWSLTASRFVPSLGEMRKRLDTNGEIELKMLDLFFSSVSFDKYDNADVLWRMFIKRAPELAAQAKRLISSSEDYKRAEEQARRAWETF